MIEQPVYGKIYLAKTSEIKSPTTDKMTDKINVKQSAIELIRKHFGDSIASLYEDSFTDKQDVTVLAILRSLLEEYLGEEQARIQMGDNLNKLYDQYTNTQ